MIFPQEQTHSFLHQWHQCYLTGQKKLSIEIKKPLNDPLQCLINQIQVQQLSLAVVTNQVPDHT